MAKKKVTSIATRSIADKTTPTGIIPKPPPGEERVSLHIDIPVSVGWRIKMALLLMEGEGTKITKKVFVEDALVKELDRFDAERGG